MFLVSELAKQCEVTTDAIRYYTRLGLLKPERNMENDYRLYNKVDIKRLKFIHRAKHLGYTLNEITQIFQECEKSKSPCPKVREIIQRRIVENRKKIDQALKLQEHMEKALVSWEDMPDGVPDGHTICLLIESFDEN
jgi:MerR family transcriptional regulator, Zn(II)-responsive regulator of zntA